LVQSCLPGVQVVFHAATLHKPHVATHSRQDFIDTNITGTLQLLEEAVAAGLQSFIFTSTTSVLGDALVPAAGAPAAWVAEEITPVPKNIYGVSKVAAEDLCQLLHRNQKLACIVLRTPLAWPSITGFASSGWNRLFLSPLQPINAPEASGSGVLRN
jgi:UDP-glucose 4-epimerase